MKFDARFRPELVCSKDETRYNNLTHPYFDAKRGKVVATDGYRLVVIPAERGAREKSRWIPCLLLDLAREWLETHRMAGEDPAIEIEGDAIVGGPSWPCDMPKGAIFPDWTKAVPDRAEGTPGTLTLAVDAAYLVSLAEALGGSSRPGTGRSQVVITIDVTKPDSPLAVRLQRDYAGDAFAVLMPCKLDTGAAIGSRVCVKFVPEEKA